MSPILFNCTCCKTFSTLKSPTNFLPLSEIYHKELEELLFCEECDSIRCNDCVLIEINCYFCPNCLFEVPSASVRLEKNTCARNCFQCPECTHTLSVVATDPDPTIPLNSPAASSGEPPYYLSCNFCRWDSKEVGIIFEKPTGLAHQLQKGEDNAPEILEFDHLKDHLEPFLRRGQQQQQQQTNSNQILLPHASTSTLSSSILNHSTTSRYAGTLFGLNSRSSRLGGGGGGEMKGVRDELEEYKSLSSSSTVVGKGKMVDRDSEMVNRMRNMTDISEVASLDKRWTNGFNSSPLASDLKPLRTPLHSKQSKRCPICKHILIKPEQKSSSTRFKIKLVASNYLPAITILRRAPISSLTSSRLSSTTAGGSVSGNTSSRRGGNTSTMGGGKIGGFVSMEDEPLRPGRTYSFELSFINPLYEPIQVRLAVARPVPSTSPSSSTSNTAQVPEVEIIEGSMPPPSLPSSTGTTTAPPPYAVNLPTSSFSIKAHAEEWEYEDEENNVSELEDDEMLGLGGGGSGRESPSKKIRRGAGTAGIIERKGNRTTVLMEVAIGKETVGIIRANMLVTYTYQSDDLSPPTQVTSSSSSDLSPLKSPSKKSSTTLEREKEEMKKFSFWTLITLGTVKESTSSTRDRERRTTNISSLSSSVVV